MSLTVNAMTSQHTTIPYDYYDTRFKFCTPVGGPQPNASSLGAVLFGDRVYNSPFELFMEKNETCKVLCQVEYKTAEETNFMIDKIQEDYVMNW